MSVYRVIGRNIWRQQRRVTREKGRRVVESWQAWRHRLAVEWNRMHPPPRRDIAEGSGIPHPARRTA